MSEGGAYERFYDGVGALISGSATLQFVSITSAKTATRPIREALIRC